ncbi:MAG: LD-carboxypeptidase [Bacteroidales bacterium]
MITPPPLKPGDKTGIISPSGKIGKGFLDNTVKLFKEWGFNVVEGNHVYSAHNQFGGTDRERISDLQYMLDERDIKAVICSRGGYGAVRVIDNIDFSRFIESPKWIVGYSDITVLHSHINGNFRIESIHGPMAAELYRKRKVQASAKSMQLLKEVLTGSVPEYDLPGHPLSRSGRAEGMLTGGNLSVIYSLLGSPSFPDTDGKILFIEDVGEYLYHIDRMMVALRRSGILGRLAGLLVGGLTGMNDNKVPFGITASEIIAGAVDDYDYPVCFGFPAGHQPENYPLILGREVALSVGRNLCSLTFG